MVHRAIQTEAVYVCDQCSVIDEFYNSTPFTIQLRGLLTKHLARSLYLQNSRIAEHTSLWPACMVRHAFEIIPSVLIPSLISLICTCRHYLSSSQINDYYIPPYIIPSFLLHFHNMIYVCHNIVFSSIFLPLTYYVTVERWQHTFPPLISSVYSCLINFYDTLPRFIDQCDTFPTITPSILFRSVITTLTASIQSYEPSQQQYFNKLYTQLPSQTYRDTLPTRPRMPESLTESLSDPSYSSHYVPTIQHTEQRVTAEDLRRFVTYPELECDLTHNDQFFYYTYVSAPLHRISHIALLLDSPLSSVAPFLLRHDTDPIQTEQSFIFHEAYESFTPQATMANPAPNHPPHTKTPPQLPPTHSRSSQTQIRRQSETSPPLTQDIVNTTVQHRIDDLWNNQIEPHLARNTERMQKHLDDVHQQMQALTHALNTQIQRLSHPTPPNDQQSCNSPPRIQDLPPFTNQYQDNTQRYPPRSTTDRYEDPTTEQRLQPFRPSNQIIQPPPYHNNPPHRDSTRSTADQPLDLREFLTGTRHPMLTAQDMERFARKAPDKLTDQQITAFAEQLEAYLTHDPNNREFLAEGNALRKLIQYTRPRRLGAWLQLYANPSIRFRFPKTEFWQRKYDDNAHLCMPQPNYKPDISECIEQLTRTLAIRLDTQPTPNFRNNQQLTNNTFNNNPYSHSRNFTPNNFRNMNQNQPNFPPRNNFSRNDFPRNDSTRDDFNRQPFNRNDLPRNDYPRNTPYTSNNNNRSNFSPQGQHNNAFPRNSFDNRPQYQSNTPQQPQQQRQYPQQQQQPYQPRPQQQQQSPQFQQRPNNFDNRNQQNRNNDTRQQTFQRRNNNYNQNNIDDIPQDIQDIDDIQHDIQDITPFELPPPATNCIDTLPDDNEEDF